jgi:chaperonin GroES
MEKRDMKLVPFHDNVFVERDEVEEKKSPGGIFLPKKVQDRPDTAVVLAVGPGRVLGDGSMVKPSVKEGDRVLIGRFSGTEVNWDGESKLVVSWGDIMGIVENDVVEND